MNNNTKSEYTQTEEIFFQKHWTYFAGQYKIIDCGPRLIRTNQNYFGVSTNLFGQLRTRGDFFKNAVVSNYKGNNSNNKRYSNLIKQNRNKENLNNSNGIGLLRPQSFNNKLIFNKKNIRQQKQNFDNNKNNNINNLLNFSQKNNNSSINNGFINDKIINNDKIRYGLGNNQNNIVSNMKTNLDRTRLAYIAKNYNLKETNKSYNKDNANSFNKTSSYFSNLFKGKQGNN
jgi:hypothetical protein